VTNVSEGTLAVSNALVAKFKGIERVSPANSLGTIFNKQRLNFKFIRAFT
jgi:hypothetical protein